MGLLRALNIGLIYVSHVFLMQELFVDDHTRVRLTSGDVDFINASFVQIAEAHREYILCQGPLPLTSGHFWQMCWEQKSNAVIMLNRILEKNMVFLFLL